MGENYVSEEDVLIKPTSKLSKMLEDEGVSATFFADVLCPIRYRELSKYEFPEAFDNQIKEMHAHGHDVQLHIHPHWLKASKVGSKIEFERHFYRIHNWQKDNGDITPIKNLIHIGKEYLTDILLPIAPDYRCIAYRAGGYCLQPESIMAPILYSEGIRIDSSVCRGFSYNKDGMNYDYTKMPKVVNQYFNERIGLLEAVGERPAEGGIFEVPCWSYNSFPYRIIASKKNLKISKSKENGHGMSLTPQRPLTFLDRLKGIFTSSNMLTFDFYHSDSMIYMINKIADQRLFKHNEQYISIVSHPKAQSDKHQENMRRAIIELKKNPNIRFVSMSQIAKIKGI